MKNENPQDHENLQEIPVNFAVTGVTRSFQWNTAIAGKSYTGTLLEFYNGSGDILDQEFFCDQEDSLDEDQINEIEDLVLDALDDYFSNEHDATWLN